MIGLLGDAIARAVAWLTTQSQTTDPDAKLKAAGSMAVERAAAMWSLDVCDPARSDKSEKADRWRKQIDTFIRSDLGWTWEPPYAGDGAFEWCGAFAAFCWRPVRADLRKTYFASTYRLDRYARYGSVNGEKNPKPKDNQRLLAECDEHTTLASLPFAPRAGDIITIGPAGSGYGKHICLVESVNGNQIATIEGNGTGIGPDHQRRQGVVRGLRALGMDGMRVLQTTWHVRRVIRPSVWDLE